jgi:predicted transcriptional regulator with HTH domain
MPSEEEAEQRILECLRKAYPRDLSTKEIAVAVGIDRNSLRGYLYGLRKAGLIYPTRQIGRAKLYALVIPTKHIENQNKNEETYVHKEKPTKQRTLLEEELLSTK